MVSPCIIFLLFIYSFNKYFLILHANDILRCAVPGIGETVLNNKRQKKKSVSIELVFAGGLTEMNRLFFQNNMENGTLMLSKG